MKSVILSVAVVAALVCSSVQAEGRVSQDALAQMGLSNMTQMSDQDGMAVRGKFAVAFGVSRASGNLYSSTNVGIAVKPNFAFQKNGSIGLSGKVVFGFPVVTGFSAAGGFSYAGGY